MTEPIKQKPTTYKNQQIGDDFLIDNPKIAKLYPSKEEVRIARNSLLAKTLEGFWSELEISENGIKYFPNVGQYSNSPVN